MSDYGPPADYRIGVSIGIAAGLLYGLSGALAGGALKRDMSAGWYLLIVGVSIAAVGLLFLTHEHRTNGGIGLPSSEGWFYTLANGLVWGCASALVVLALKNKVPFAIVVPLYSTNAFFAVIIGLFLVREWDQVKWPWLTLGGLLSLSGAVIVSFAKK